MDSTQSTTVNTWSKQLHWKRDRVSELVHQIRLDQHGGASLTRCAVENRVPRTTAQNWLRKRARLEQQSGLAPATVEFFRITPRARVPT
jgi:hypothetical protein